MTDKLFDLPIEINKIKELLPHRYPLLLVDRVIDYSLEPEVILTAIKNVTVNEPTNMV